jgi:Fur family ferric uptake transcriptional regulator
MSIGIIWGMTKGSTLVAALDQAGYRLTGPRRALADLIANREGHFTAADLVAAARRRRLAVGRATIFRALEALTRVGAVERLDLPNGEHAYVVCEPSHHHHIVCSSCGQVADVVGCDLTSLASEVGLRSGYRVDTHRVELYGTCPDCQRHVARAN